MDTELIVFDILTEEGPPYDVIFVTDQSRSRRKVSLGTLSITLQIHVLTGFDSTRLAHEAELAAREGPPEPILEVLIWDRFGRVGENGDREPCPVRLLPGVL